jgi:cell division protein FtsL
MASWQATAAAPPARAPARPRPQPRPAPKRRAKSTTGVAGGLAWIVVAGVLLAGIVALNVAVLRLNVQLDRMNNQSDKLRAENAALGAKISAAASSPRIQALAKAHGFLPADPTTIGYIDLTPRRAR